VEQISAAGDIGGKAIDVLDYEINSALFLADFAGFVGVIPRFRVFERGVELF
jgi:hypothetical protein